MQRRFSEQTRASVRIVSTRQSFSIVYRTLNDPPTPNSFFASIHYETTSRLLHSKDSKLPHPLNALRLRLPKPHQPRKHISPPSSHPLRPPPLHPTHPTPLIPKPAGYPDVDDNNNECATSYFQVTISHFPPSIQFFRSLFKPFERAFLDGRRVGLIRYGIDSALVSARSATLCVLIGNT